MGKYTSDDNRSMQLNDNNDRYYSSRGIDRDELDYDFEEDDDNIQGENMSFFRIDNQLVRKSTITHIEPSYEISFKKTTITKTCGSYHQRKSEVNIITSTPRVFLTIHTNFGKTFTKEFNTKGIESYNMHYGSHQRLEDIKPSDNKIFDLSQKFDHNNRSGRPEWHTETRLFEYTTCFKSETFNEKTLTDYMEKYFFKYANSCIITLLDNVNKVEE